MSATGTSQVTDQGPQKLCTLCGRPLAADQEWCLECGAARTVVTSAPDWRVPLVVIGVVVLLVVAGVAYALSQLGNRAPTVIVVTRPSTGTRIGAAAVGSWAPGLDGYTVILATATSQAAADAVATRLAPHSADVGVLSTRQHPQMHAHGVWEVFAGRYPTYALAEAAAAQATHRGHPRAHPSLVQRPGGG